jgi:hypothetical protein
MASTSDEILRGIEEGRTFDNWEQIEELKEALFDFCFMPTQWQQTREISSYNRIVSLDFKQI